MQDDLPQSDESSELYLELRWKVEREQIVDDYRRQIAFDVNHSLDADPARKLQPVTYERLKALLDTEMRYAEKRGPNRFRQ